MGRQRIEGGAREGNRASGLERGHDPRAHPGSQAIRLTIADLLSYVRLAAIPALLVLAALDLRGAFLWLLAAAWFTDAIDGPLARMLGQDSARGARLDSLADRLLMISIPLCVACTRALDRLRSNIPSWWHLRRSPPGT